MRLRVVLPVILMAVLASACISVPYESDQIRIAPAPLPGRPAPDFAVDSPDLEGLTALSDLRGQVVLVNFWATWCDFCRDEMPALEKVYQDYKDQGFLILGVNVGENWSKVETFRQEVDFSFPITMDSGSEIFKSYWGRGIPNSFIIDQNGFIVYVHYGEINEEQLVKVLKEIGFETP